MGSEPDCLRQSSRRNRGGPDELATMLYFSLTTLTTTGYGDIVPVDPFARSLANLESVLGQFYLAITVARLVTLELEDRLQNGQAAGEWVDRHNEIGRAHV